MRVIKNRKKTVSFQKEGNSHHPNLVPPNRASTNNIEQIMRFIKNRSKTNLCLGCDIIETLPHQKEQKQK